MWQPFVVVLLAVRVHVGGIAWIPRWGMLMPEVSSFAWIFNEQYLHSIVQLQVTSFLDVEVGQPESAARVCSLGEVLAFWLPSGSQADHWTPDSNADVTLIHTP